jgi:glutaredoxin
MTILYISICLYLQVPRVFIGGEFIGGGSETAALQSSGQLVPKLKSVGAL